MRWILIVILTFLLGQSFAQETSEALVRLNRHYFEIAEGDSTNHAYNMLVSYTKDSTRLERIFTLNNKISRIVWVYPEKEKLHEMVVEQYNDYLELQWRSTINLLNFKSSTLYYLNNEVVGQLLAESSEQFFTIRAGETKPRPEKVNDFEPRINGFKDRWPSFFTTFLDFDKRLLPEYTEEFYIAVLVNEQGVAEQIEWANPMGGNPQIADQYIRLIEKWGNNFSPALDPFGTPISKWLYVPFRVLGFRGSPRDKKAVVDERMNDWMNDWTTDWSVLNNHW